MQLRREMVLLTDMEVEDLMSVDVDDEFMEENLRGMKFDAELSHRLLQGACDHFVRTFLGEDNGVVTLHHLLQGCDTSLAEIENVLQNFIVNLETIQREIGDVRERLRHVGLRLGNARATEHVMWGFVSRFVVPPEVVRVIVHCNDEELGTQFKLSTKSLLHLLRNRKAGSCHLVDNATPIALTACRSYSENLEVLDRLTVHACVKVKRFLSKKLVLLSVKNTNVLIQQEHVLKPHAFYVHFLRSAAPLLHHPHQDGSADAGPTPLLPFYIVKALYDELRHEYCNIMSELYLSRIRHYVMVLSSMETPSPKPHSGGGGGFGGGMARMCVPPLLADTRGESLPLSCFQLGERAAILDHIMSPPLVPTVERAKRHMHSYEETFRSMTLLLCDAVTHEFLFTFTFFSGDVPVFVNVLKPTIQFIVDYVSEVMLRQREGSARRVLRDEFSHVSLNKHCQNDCYGLLLLIRFCHEFRSLMKNVRRLSCLEGFFDSLLLLLWPAFQRTLEWQMLSLRSANVTSLASMVKHRQRGSNGGVPCDWVVFIHPLAERYAVFTNSLVTIIGGCGVEETDNTNGAPRLLNMVESSSSLGSANDGVGDQNWNGEEGDKLDDLNFSELQRIAWRAIEAERASDTSENASRLAVLEGNLLFMRVEVVRLLEEIGRSLAASMDARRPGVREQHALAFSVNNLHHILCAWRECLECNHTAAFRENVSALEELMKLRRGELVELLLRGQFSSVYSTIEGHDGSECDPAEVLAAADVFMQNWKRGLDDICGAVRMMISDATHEGEVLVQVCMEVLLCNTRFHASVTRAVETLAGGVGKGGGEQHRPLRSFIVTNQQMLHYMRTLASIPQDGGEASA